MFSDESRLQLCPDDNHRRILRRPRQRVEPALTIAHHIGLQQNVMVWDAISFDSRTPKVIVSRILIVQRYIDDILTPVVSIFILRHPAHTFQQDNSRLHTELVTLNCLQACTILP